MPKFSSTCARGVWPGARIAGPGMDSRIKLTTSTSRSAANGNHTLARRGVSFFVMRSSDPPSTGSLEQPRFHEIELLDEAESGRSRRRFHSRLERRLQTPTCESKRPDPVRLARRDWLICPPWYIAPPLPASAEIVSSRKCHHPQIDLRTGHMVLIVVARAEREIQRMMGVSEKPAREVALDCAAWLSPTSPPPSRKNVIPG